MINNDLNITPVLSTFYELYEYTSYMSYTHSNSLAKYCTFDVEKYGYMHTPAIIKVQQKMCENISYNDG